MKSSPALSDRLLIDRCLAGETRAWEELYEQQQPNLLSTIRSLPGSRSWDAHLVDEIAARVWYAVVSQNGRLLNNFDPRHQCRLSTFLGSIARTEAAQFFRSERRRRNREAISSQTQTHAEPASERRMAEEMQEFLTHLTPREKEFCVHHLLDGDAPLPISQANGYQLRSRIRRKLTTFLAG